MTDRYGMMCVLAPIPDDKSAPPLEWAKGAPEDAVIVGDEVHNIEEFLVELSNLEIQANEID